MQGRCDSYIRSYRRKTHLSQEDVAFLLGKTSGTSVSRHERGRRAPTVQTALAYEIILGQSIGELYRQCLILLKNEIAIRAEQLLQLEVPDSVIVRAPHAKRLIELKRIADHNAISHNES